MGDLYKLVLVTTGDEAAPASGNGSCPEVCNGIEACKDILAENNDQITMVNASVISASRHAMILTSRKKSKF